MKLHIVPPALANASGHAPMPESEGKHMKDKSNKGNNQFVSATTQLISEAVLPPSGIGSDDFARWRKPDCFYFKRTLV